MLPTPNTRTETKANKNYFCEHVCRHQTKGVTTSIQMRTWWATGKAGWRRRFLKQSYFSKPSLEIHKFTMPREKAGKCYKWPSIPVPSLREVTVLHLEEHDQDHSSWDPGSVWNKTQLWITWRGLVTKLRFMVTRLDNVCQGPSFDGLTEKDTWKTTFLGCPSAPFWYDQSHNFAAGKKLHSGELC